MFGDDYFDDQAGTLLGGFTFEEIIDHNNLTEEEVLSFLLMKGLISSRGLIQ